MGPLPHSPAEIVARMFIARGDLNLPPATLWPVFIGHEPDTPDNCVTLYTTTGRKRGRIMIDGQSYILPGIQVRVRSITGPVGHSKASMLYSVMEEDIYNYLVTIGARRYLINNINLVSNIIDVGYESPTSKRNIHTINALLNVIQL